MWKKVITIATVATLMGLAFVEMPVRAQQGGQPAQPPAGGGGGGRGGGAQVSPDILSLAWKDAAGVKGIIYNWANHMGMMRNLNEREAIATLEYFATGTVTVKGQPCKLTKLRSEINYQMAGQRQDYACTVPGGQTITETPAVGAQWAWDEVGGPGAGLVPGKGTAAPRPDAYNERAIRLWSNPQSAVKAAVAGKAATKTGMEAGKITVTYPVPGVAGAMATATLIAGPIDGVCTRHCAERIVVRQGTDVTEFTFTKYADYNDPEEQLDAFWAGQIVEKKNGVVVQELITSRTNTPNYYIVVPLPQAVKSTPPVGTAVGLPQVGAVGRGAGE